MKLQILEKSVQSSVLIALGFGAFCSGIYGLNWLQIGHGSWERLLEGTANIAGPTVIFALAINLFVRFPEKDRAQ